MTLSCAGAWSGRLIHSLLTLSFALFCNSCCLLENYLIFHLSGTGSDVALLLCYRWTGMNISKKEVCMTRFEVQVVIASSINILSSGFFRNKIRMSGAQLVAEAHTSNEVFTLAARLRPCFLYKRLWNLLDYGVERIWTWNYGNISNQELVVLKSWFLLLCSIVFILVVYKETEQRILSEMGWKCHVTVQVWGFFFFLVWESILVLEVSESNCESSYCTLMLTVPLKTSTLVISPDTSFTSPLLFKIQEVCIRGSDTY